ncbi:hypothetical protein 2016_scaffold57_00071 [Bacteriophage sp.]|nr:hypothetical protein 2016_scaffold57_00071 [Bacteriophage sp.]
MSAPPVTAPAAQSLSGCLRPRRSQPRFHRPPALPVQPQRLR